MQNIYLAARIVTYILLVIAFIPVIQHALELYFRNDFDEHDPSTFWLREIYYKPGIFWMLLLIEILRVTVIMILIYAIHLEKYILVYLFILMKTVYVMVIYVVMPLSYLWVRYLTQPINLIQAWIYFPYYCFDLYVMMLFYTEIEV